MSYDDLYDLPTRTEWVNGEEVVTQDARERRLDALLSRSDYAFERKHDRLYDRDHWLAKPKGASVDEQSVDVCLDCWGDISVWFADAGEWNLYKVREAVLLQMVNAFCCKIGMQPKLVVAE